MHIHNIVDFPLLCRGKLIPLEIFRIFLFPIWCILTRPIVWLWDHICQWFLGRWGYGILCSTPFCSLHCWGRSDWIPLWVILYLGLKGHCSNGYLQWLCLWWGWKLGCCMSFFSTHYYVDPVCLFLIGSNVTYNLTVLYLAILGGLALMEEKACICPLNFSDPLEE